MYAIVREGNGKFYTSMVFGFYKSPDAQDYRSKFWVILNKEKTALIKQPVLQPDTEYLIPMLLITDADECNWNKLSEHAQSVDFLPTSTLPSLIEDQLVPVELTQKCIDLDKAYHFEPIQTVATAEDLRDLEWVSGEFHDAHIAELKQHEDALYVLFDGTWGCKIEVWFEGEVSYDISSKDPDLFDPYWYSSTVAIKDGFTYLIDSTGVSPDEIGPAHCWFKARHMKYHVIPD